MSFATLKTRIDGLDGILGGGIRYPDDSAVFLCLAGGPGTGKTLLALEIVVRAWLEGEDGAKFLYYSVEHTPESIHKKLASDFDFYGATAKITALPREVPGRRVLEATSDLGTTRLIVIQARPAALVQKSARGTMVDIEWILAEVENHHRAAPLNMVVIDNVGLLLTDLEYFEKRAALLETRRRLLEHRIHGIFVMEEAHPRDLRLPSAEEFSTDIMIYLSFREETPDFKARAIEIAKARHQYFYRGIHHFSLAGRGITRDVYLGARNERGPGMHIYPSVAAQLSMARDQARFKVPPRGTATIDLGHPDLDRAFLHDTGPAERSSTVLLAEPGTRSTFLALRFLAAGLRAGETVLLVSTLEDRDAIRRICQREPVLRDLCLTPEGSFATNFRVVYLHPEFISPGKFTWDLMRLCQGGHAHGKAKSVRRMAFDNIHRLQDRFPLIRNQRFLIAAMLDMVRYLEVTPLFIDMVPPGNRRGSDFDPSPYLVGFDNVLHLFIDQREQGARPFLRVVKSVGNDYVQEPVSIDWRRV